LEINPITIIRVIKQQNHPLRFLLAKMLIKLKLSKFFIIDRKYYKLRFYPSSFSRVLWIDSTAGIVWDILCRDYLKSGENMIDVGANIGTLTLASATAVGKNGKVFSFEPHPKIYQFLLKNIELNKIKNIQSYNIAVSNKNETVFFSDMISDDQNKVLQNNCGIKIEAKTLDYFEFYKNRISLLKIDVEGYELLVLQGGEKTIEHTDCIYLEMIESSYHEFGYSSGDILNFLSVHGFEIFIIKDKQITKISNDTKLGKGHHILAIKNINDFLERTNYTICE
jgi:FkbM family methyltransferase